MSAHDAAETAHASNAEAPESKAILGDEKHPSEEDAGDSAATSIAEAPEDRGFPDDEEQAIEEEGPALKLRHLYRYALPMLLTVETMNGLTITGKQQLVLRQSTWWLALITTRHLLAHVGIMLKEEHERDFIKVLSANIRNLLRVLDIDIAAQRTTFSAVKTDYILRYQKYQEKEGKEQKGTVFFFDIDFKKVRTGDFSSLETCTHDDMKNDLKHSLTTVIGKDHTGRIAIQHAFAVFGWAAHKMLPSWQTKTSTYAEIDIHDPIIHGRQRITVKNEKFYYKLKAEQKSKKQSTKSRANVAPSTGTFQAF